MKVLLDNGHGENTAGKRSPKWRDGSQLFEWEYTREIAQRVEFELIKCGVDVERIVKENIDVSLRERCNRVNEVCAEVGAKNCILVSIHCNAAGNGLQPMSAQGWSVFVSLNASSKSKEMADSFCDAAIANGVKLRVYSPKQRFWAQNLAMCRDTKCAAVLTENLFMDNEEDCRYLLSNEGKKVITQIHVQAILNLLGK